MPAYKDKMKQAITIMADFGNGPYAWLNKTGDRSKGVGSNIADITGGFNPYAAVSKELKRDFAEWAAFFENHYDEPAFDWKQFNERGIALSRSLKAEIKDTYDVYYEAPFEDPIEGSTLRMKIDFP